MGQFADYLAEELRSIQIRCLHIIGIPRTSLPTLEDRCKVATIKRELKRIVIDINLTNQNFLTKPNTSHGYNLRSKPGSVAIPKSGTQRHTDSFLARAVRFLLLWSVSYNYYLPLLEIYLIVFHRICFPLWLCKSIVYVVFKEGKIQLNMIIHYYYRAKMVRWRDLEHEWRD